MSINLTTEQRSFLTDTALSYEEEALREGSSLPLRELADRALLIARLEDFAEGASLAVEDRTELVTILRTHRDEQSEAAAGDEAKLPKLLDGDPRYVYAGYTREESVEMLKSYIARERNEAVMCAAIMAQLGTSPEPAVA
jgi:hypothetical protein